MVHFKEWSSEDVRVQLSWFDNGTEVIEAQAFIHVIRQSLPFSQQLQVVHNAWTRLSCCCGLPISPVFKRYYLSDMANQIEEVKMLERSFQNSPYACSYIEQPPLDGTKVALYTYLMAGMKIERGKEGCTKASHNGYTHLWEGGRNAVEGGPQEQTESVMQDYAQMLVSHGSTLEDNCIRTWLFVDDIDRNYRAVVQGRNQVFTLHQLIPDTHFIASTGIGGRGSSCRSFMQMDAYAIAGVDSRQIRYLYASSLMNRTSEYGVRFERGTCVDYGDRRHVFISGTASINNKGEIMHVGDIQRQTERMLENVAALLEEADCVWGDVTSSVVYLRDMADAELVRQLLMSVLKNIPFILVWAPVCRPGWLIEMECMATKTIHTTFPAY